MYQVALLAMGPRLAERIVQTIGFHRMEISLLDSAVGRIGQSLDHSSISYI